MDGDGGFGDPAAMVDAFQQSPQLLGVVEGPELRLIAGSGAMFATMAGKQLLGVPLRESFAEVVGQQIIDRYEACFRTGEVQVAKEWRTVIDPGNGRDPFEIYIDFLLYPWRDADGSVRGVVATATDVTESVARRQQAERGRAVAEQRYRDAVAVVTDLQEALLPEALPVVPDLDVAASYLLATEDTAAGGDWFDALVRPDGRVALVVGDVVGHGVKASAAMGQLRAVLHQQLLAGSGVPDALGALDLFARAVPEAYAATVCVAVVDPEDGALDYCTAGHPPPLVVSADGTHRFLEPTGAGPLATGATFGTVQASLVPGELLLLYSDGIVERPGRTPAQNTVELLRVVADAYLDRAIPEIRPGSAAERVCEQTIELLTRLSGHSDGITLLAAQPVPRPEPFHWSGPAVRESVGEVRSELAGWLAQVRAGSADQLALQHAVGELVTNAVDHAYEGVDDPVGERPVQVRGDVARDAQVTLTVSDAGAWREPRRDGARGRGLAMVQALVDGVEVSRDGRGTTVSVRQQLTRPARLLRDGERAVGRPASRPDGDAFAVGVDDAAATLTVSGALDAATAEALRLRLERATRGGSSPVTVDLSGVTLLASAGVRVLHELHGTGALRLTAPPGSPAQHVLEIVGLPYAPPQP